MTKTQLARKKKHQKIEAKLAKLEKERKTIDRDIRKFQTNICTLGIKIHILETEMGALSDLSTELEIKGWPEK